MDSINSIDNQSIDNLMDNTLDKVLDDLSDDSIDPQIEYDLIINENTCSFGSMFATTEDIDKIEDKRQSEELIPIETTIEVIVESIGDKNDVKQRSEETTIEDKDNELKSKVNDGSGDPQNKPIIDENAINSVTEESISDSKTKSAKKSSEKTKKTKTSKIKDDKKSKGKTPLIGALKKSAPKTDPKNKSKGKTPLIGVLKKSTPKTGPKSNSKGKTPLIGAPKKSTPKTDSKNKSKDIKKKSVPKRVKSIDKKYKTKKKSVEMSAEFLDQLFGKNDGHSADGNQTEATNCSEYESMYSKQCEEWFQRQTRHKKYNFSEDI